MTEWLNDLESNGATIDELDDAFSHVEALDQYDEAGRGGVNTGCTKSSGCSTTTG
jgi:hypothetical protein